MDYSTVYNKSLQKQIKYGKAPDEDVDHWTELGAKGGTVDPNNNADAIFADKLNDHEDPREELVRQDLTFRPDSPIGPSYYRKLRHAATSKFGEQHGYLPSQRIDIPTPKYPQGHLIVDPIIPAHQHVKTPPLGHQITWYPHPDHSYMGLLTPEETDKFFASLQLPHTSESLHKAAAEEIMRTNRGTA